MTRLGRVIKFENNQKLKKLKTIFLKNDKYGMPTIEY